MKKDPTLLILIILFYCQITTAQNIKKMDSLISVYKNLPENTSKLSVLQRLYYVNVRTNIEKALNYAQEQNSLATKLGDDYHIFLSNFNLGQYYYLTEKRDTANYYFNQAQAQRNNNEKLKNSILVTSRMAQIHYYKVEDDKALSFLDRNIAIQDSLNLENSIIYGNDLLLKAKINQVYDNLEKQLEYSLKALKVFEANKEQLKKADALIIVASVDNKVGKFDKGLEHQLIAMDIYRKYGDKKKEMITLSYIGSTYVMLNQRSLAKNYFEEVLRIATELELLDWVATAYDKLGGLEVEAGNYDEGIILLAKGVEILRKSKNKYTLGIALLNLGNAYYDKKSYKKAIRILNECISISEKNHVLYRAYEFRSASNEGLNNYKVALLDFKKFKTIRDSVWNIDKSKQIEELRAIYDAEKKEHQIVLHKNEIDLLEEKSKVNTLQRSLFGVGFLLSIGVLGLGFYGFKQKIKQNKLEKEKLDIELDFKKKELTTQALHLAKKNEVLESLKQKAEELKSSEDKNNGYQQLIRTINFDLQNDNNWENFSHYFQQVHEDFNSKVKQYFQDLTTNELRLLSLLKMNLTSKEMANILNISYDGIKKARYRLRKKLKIASEESLQDIVINL